MSYDNQLARRLAVHNKARRASRTKRPMCIQPRYYTNKGMVWNLIGNYGQVVAGYRTPAKAKAAMRACQYLQRAGANPPMLKSSGRRFMEANPYPVEVCFVETDFASMELRATAMYGSSCVRE